MLFRSASKAGAVAAAEAQRSRMAMGAVQTALLGCQMFAQNLRYYSFVADTGSDYAYVSLAARLPASFPGSGLFGDQVLRRVTFAVEPGRYAGNDLVMYQMPLLLATNATIQPIPITLARDVRLFTLEFWDVRRGEWLAEWLPTNQLPVMVRVSLALGGERNQATMRPEDVMTRVVALPAVAVAAQPGGAGGPGGGGQPGRGPTPGTGTKPPPVRR